MRTFDVRIIDSLGHDTDYLFGPNGGLLLGNALKEPSNPQRVDSILIESFHHGAGRVLNTDPFMYRDTNGQAVGADVRQPGFILPGGALSLIATVPITSAPIPKSYAGAFVNSAGNVVFNIGRQQITITVATDSVASVDALSANQFFTGSVVEWLDSLWLGVMNASRVTVGAFKHGVGLVTDTSFMFSWAVSTKNSIFWIRNRGAGVPSEMRWSDKTDDDFDDIDDTPSTGFVYGPFFLEIPRGQVTGMGTAGPFAVFCSRGGNIWGFDNTEVFIPLTPDSQAAFFDDMYGGPMAFVGTWLLIPYNDGLRRFDPRTITQADITPAAHQGSSPDYSPVATSRRVEAACQSPTGAVVFTRFGGVDPALLHLEMYEDGMFYHIGYQGLDVSRVAGGILTRVYDAAAAEFTSRLRLYFIALADNGTDLKVYRQDVPTLGWQPGPENMAAISGLRTLQYTARPADVMGQPSGLRGWASASEENYITLFLEVDGGEPQEIGRITKTGTFALPVSSDTLPGRKFALATNLTIGNTSGVTPYIAMPLSLDYLYVPQSAEGKPDFVTITIEATSDQIDKSMGRRFSHGRTETEYLVGLQGQIVEVYFGDRDEPWKVVVEEAISESLTEEGGTRQGSHTVKMACRRLE